MGPAGAPRILIAWHLWWFPLLVPSLLHSPQPVLSMSSPPPQEIMSSSPRTRVSLITPSTSPSTQHGALHIRGAQWTFVEFNFSKECGLSLLQNNAILPKRCVLQPFKARQVHMGFRQMGENLQSLGDAWHAFIHRWGDPRTLQACVHQPKSQLPYVLNAHKAGRVPKYCITECDSAHVGPLKVMEVMGIQFIGPCLKAMGILLILVTQTSGWGSQTDSIYTIFLKNNL